MPTQHELSTHCMQWTIEHPLKILLFLKKWFMLVYKFKWEWWSWIEISWYGDEREREREGKKYEDVEI